MNKELCTLLSEMKRKNLTVEAEKIEQIVGDKKEYYQDIVFFQSTDDFDDFEGGSDVFFDADENEQLDYLLQWDTGEGKIINDISDYPIEIKRNNQTYYLSLNSRLGYAGLVRLIPEDEYSDFDITPEEED